MLGSEVEFQGLPLSLFVTTTFTYNYPPYLSQYIVPSISPGGSLPRTEFVECPINELTFLWFVQPSDHYPLDFTHRRRDTHDGPSSFERTCLSESKQDSQSFRFKCERHNEAVRCPQEPRAERYLEPARVNRLRTSLLPLELVRTR